MKGLHQISGQDGRDDGGELAEEVDDAGDFAHVVARGDERYHRPGNGRGGCQSADGDADPDEGVGGIVRPGRAENAEAKASATDENDAPD